MDSYEQDDNRSWEELTREEKRQRSLETYQILDTLPEKEFDDLTKLASNICDAPISMINLIDSNRQWSKSTRGWDIEEIPREKSFCAHTIQGDQWMIVEDAKQDQRFEDSPFVTGEPNIRFYAGFNLKSREGYNLGSLCVIDKEPRELTEQQKENLQIIANEVMARLELRRSQQELRQKNEHLALRSAFLNNSTDLLLILDPEKLTIERSFEQTPDILGYPDHQSLKNLPLAELLEGRTTEELRQKVEAWWPPTDSADTKRLQLEALLSTEQESRWFELTFTREAENKLYLTGKDIQDRKSYESQLEQSRDFANSIVDALPGVFYMLDSEHRLIRWNHEVERVTGYKAQELEKMSIDQLVHPDDMEVTLQKIEKLQHEETASIEIRIQTEEGNSIPYYFSSTLFDDGQAQYIVGSGFDLTEKNRYERQLEASLKEREVLLSEIHHRVKNNLAVISGLLDLELFKTENERVIDILRGSQLRIKSMAMIHEKLYETTTFTSVPLGEYIRDLTGAISDIYDPDDDVDTRIESDPIKLNVNQAIPLALIVNELLTNCYKHGFDGQQKKSVDMKLRKSGDRITFEISDNGEGLPADVDPNAPESLGFTLVKTLVRQLEGELEIVNRKNSHLQLSFDAREVSGSSSNLQGNSLSLLDQKGD